MDRVGQRALVYWSDEREWFGGNVSDFDENEGYYIVYDDGDERWEADATLIKFGDAISEDDTDEQGNVTNANEAGPYSGADQIHSDEINYGDSPPFSHMLEPPESPSAYGDDYADSNGEEECDTEALPATATDKTENDSSDEERDERVGNSNINRVVESTRRQSMSDGDTNSENEESFRYSTPEKAQTSRTFQVVDVRDLGDMDDELEQSIETPETHCFDQPSSSVNSEGVVSGRLMPHRGRLYGKVVRGNGFPMVGGHCPSCFVKISFAEGGDSSEASALMLRCKKFLANTPVARGSTNPVWVGEDQAAEISSEDVAGGKVGDCHFQLDLVPPKVGSEVEWSRVQGDLILAVYSSDEKLDGGQSSTFVGQGIVSLNDLLPTLLSKSPSLTRYLRLQTRSGKRLPSSSGHGSVELVVACLFIPSFPAEIKYDASERSRSSSSIRSTRSRLDGSKKCTRSSPQDKQQKWHKAAKPLSSAWAYRGEVKAPSKTASSGINRKRFEQKVAKENLDFAKRLEWKHGRRERLQADVKAQEKNRITPPQHGAKKHGHKAPSGINRTKFIEQVSAENRNLGKRLLAIAVPKKPSQTMQGFGGRDQDKALAEDKRQERRKELDFHMQKAQATYTKQSQLVAEVTVLQDDVAQLKQQMGELSRACNHLEVLNRKDRHTCDCLRPAAKKERSAAGGGQDLKPESRTKPLSRATGEEDESGKGFGMRQRESELLKKEHERLEAEKLKHSERLLSLKQEAKQLEGTAKQLDSQVRAVRSQRAFATGMKSGRKAMLATSNTQGMEQRLRGKELTNEEDQQWTLYQAHEELAQLQLAVHVLERRAALPMEGSNTTTGLLRSSSKKDVSAATSYLASKIERTTAKLKSQQEQAAVTKKEFERLTSSGAYENLRTQVQELQHLVFLCRLQPKHDKRAEKQAERMELRMDAEFNRRLLAEQTETDLLLKKQTP